jgi:hypothetical protein
VPWQTPLGCDRGEENAVPQSHALNGGRASETTRLRAAYESLLFCAKGQRAPGREFERMARILGELGLGRICEDLLGVHDLADAI